MSLIASNLVIHPNGKLCQSMAPPGRPWWEDPHCPTCTCPERHGPVLQNGRWVSCGQCGETGIVADPGHEADFLPPWVKLTVRGGPDPE